MSNEILALLMLFGSLMAALFFYYLGRSYRLAFIGSVVYWMAAALDTPFMYVAKCIKPRNVD